MADRQPGAAQARGRIQYGIGRRARFGAQDDAFGRQAAQVGERGDDGVADRMAGVVAVGIALDADDAYFEICN